LQARGKEQVKATQKPAPKQEKPRQQVAPKVPGVDEGGTAPMGAAQSKSLDPEKRFQGKTSLTQEDLVAYFRDKQAAE